MATAIVVHELQKRLPKVITPDVHGLIDYAQAAFFLCAGLFLWKRNRAASVASFATGGLLLGEALITDYPLGATPVISFETHGKLDAALASASLVTPQVFGFGKTGAATLFRLNAIVDGALIGLTDYGADTGIPIDLMRDVPHNSFATERA
jgi:hypothetical protein